MRLSTTVVSQSFKKAMAAVSGMVLLFSTTFPAAAQQPANAAPAQDQQKSASSTEKMLEAPAPQKPLKTPQDFTKGNAYFPNPLGPYLPEGVAPTSFENTPRIDQLIKNETLYLSLNDAIALALENNLDIAVARYNLEIADTDILRAKSGQGIRGVASGLVQGTPGGGQGGFGTGAP